jgi:hypothetical protein
VQEQVLDLGPVLEPWLIPPPMSLGMTLMLRGIGKRRVFVIFWTRGLLPLLKHTPLLCNVYNMSGRVVSDIQTRAEGESLYIRYNTDANVVNIT